MKLFVQIPCYNEDATLPLVLNSIPQKIAGVDEIIVLVIDDGSTDKTLGVAKEYGIEHFVIHKKNMGLSQSFSDGLDYCLQRGADIIVNTDGDNQYPQKDIPKLIKPIIEDAAEIVIGDRQTHTIEHFSLLKKILQKLGSKIVNLAAGTDIPDAVSGFRAYSRDAALKTIVINSFSYCTETIIHAGRKRMAITSVPITTNQPTRKSRLFKNMWHHVFSTTRVIAKSYFMYQPIKIFITPAMLLVLAGLLPFFRYLVLFISEGDPGAHIQSLILGLSLLVAGFLFAVLGILADLIRTNRAINEEALYRIKKMDYNNHLKTKIHKTDKN